MIAVIAEVLRDKLSEIDWIERVGGLTMTASRPVTSMAANMQTVVTGYESYPVSSAVNLADCWESGVYKLLEPDHSKSAIAFFVDGGGVEQIEIEGPKAANIRYRFNLKLLAWLNLERLGEDITENASIVSGRLSVYFMEKLMGTHSAAGLFAGGVEEDAFKWIEVKKIDQLQKSSEVLFGEYNFAKRKDLFFWPYDFFGLRITGEFVINKNCLPTFGAGWVPSDGCLEAVTDPGLPANPTTLCTRILRCLSDLDEFDTPEAGQSGGTLVDGYRFFVMGEGTDSIPYGTIMRLPDL